MRFVISRKNSLFILLLILLILGGIKFKDRVFKIYPLPSFFPELNTWNPRTGPNLSEFVVRICGPRLSNFSRTWSGPVQETTQFYPFDEFLVKWNVWVGWKRLCGRYSKRLKHMNTLKSYQIENYLI